MFVSEVGETRLSLPFSSHSKLEYLDYESILLGTEFVQQIGRKGGGNFKVIRE